MTNRQVNTFYACLMVTALLALIVLGLCGGCASSNFADRIRCPMCGEWAYCTKIDADGKQYEDRRHYVQMVAHEQKAYSTQGWVEYRTHFAGSKPLIAEKP